MKPAILSLALAALAAPASGAAGGDLIHRPGICAPGGTAIWYGPEPCAPSGPVRPVGPMRL